MRTEWVSSAEKLWLIQEITWFAGSAASDKNVSATPPDKNVPATPSWFARSAVSDRNVPVTPLGIVRSGRLTVRPADRDAGASECRSDEPTFNSATECQEPNRLEGKVVPGSETRLSSSAVTAKESLFSRRKFRGHYLWNGPSLLRPKQERPRETLF